MYLCMIKPYYYSMHHLHSSTTNLLAKMVIGSILESRAIALQKLLIYLEYGPSA